MARSPDNNRKKKKKRTAAAAEPRKSNSGGRTPAQKSGRKKKSAASSSSVSNSGAEKKRTTRATGDGAEGVTHEPESDVLDYRKVFTDYQPETPIIGARERLLGLGARALAFGSDFARLMLRGLGAIPWLYVGPGLALCVFLVWGAFYYKTGATLSKTEGRVLLLGVAEKANIRRDSLGIPHVSANSEEDLYYAMGYAMAQDRLWQMTSMKMLARGRLAEIAGPEFLEIDVYLRTAGLGENAKAAWKELPPRMRRLLSRFAGGVNAYTRANPNLPPEFFLAGYEPEPWEPIDSLYIFALVQFNLSFNLREELAFLRLSRDLGPERAAWLFPIYHDEPPPIAEAAALRGLNWQALRSDRLDALARLEEIRPAFRAASNNWALSAERTKGKAGMLANDTHLEIGMPSFWMLMSLAAPDTRIVGFMIPGIPAATMGYNGHIAWGITMLMGDSQDLFVEQLKKEENGKMYYRQGAAWEPVTERQEVFKVKGAESVTRVIRSTRRGPLLDEAIAAGGLLKPEPFQSPYGLSLRWTAQDRDQTTRGIYELNRARTLGQARSALALMDTIYLNVVYADKKHVAWQTTGRLPRRRSGRGLFPAPGWTGTHDWADYLPFSEQPFAMRPAEGFVSTANERVVKRPAPYHVSSTWVAPERKERIDELLQATREASLEDMQKMQMDSYSPLAVKVKKVVLETERAGIEAAIADIPAQEQERVRAAMEMLAKFDAHMRVDSPGAALLGALYYTVTRHIFLDELGGEDSPLWRAFLSVQGDYDAPQDHLVHRPDSPFWDNVHTRDTRETRAMVLSFALRDAYRYCEEQLGSKPSKWRWGDLHTYDFRHPISARSRLVGMYTNRGPYPASGDRHTIHLTSFRWGLDFETRALPTMRFIVDFSREEPVYLITNTGQSGNPASRHYDSMLPYFLEGRLHNPAFTEENLEKHFSDSLELMPDRSR